MRILLLISNVLNFYISVAFRINFFDINQFVIYVHQYLDKDFNIRKTKYLKWLNSKCLSYLIFI